MSRAELSIDSYWPFDLQMQMRRTKLETLMQSLPSKGVAKKVCCDIICQSLERGASKSLAS